MAAGLSQLIHHLRRLVDPPERVCDTVLLDRFVQGREEEAFAAIVARHGPMVMRVCQRVLADATGAEDCFQATFLILARKARTLGRPVSLAGWLHGVALRVASKARNIRSRHRLCQLSAGAAHLPDPHPDPLAQLTARELLIAVDEEVQRLPEVYRLPVILCCLENLSKEEAARRLGWTPGSVKARLERGRKRLEARLAKRGLTLSTALVVTAVARSAAMAGVGPGLRAATTKAAMLFATGVAPQGGAAASAAIVLAEAALQGMAAVKLKVLAWMAVLVAVAAAGLGSAARLSPDDKALIISSQAVLHQAAELGGNPRQTPRDQDPRLDRSGDPLPPGALARLGSLRFRGDHLMDMALAPNGKMAFWVGQDETRMCDVATGKTLWRIDKEQGVLGRGAAYSPNGQLAASVCINRAGDGLSFESGVTLYLWQAATGKNLTKVDLKMTGAYCLAFAPDGLVAVGGDLTDYGVFSDKAKSRSVVSLWQWNGATLTPLWEAKPDHEALHGPQPHGIRSLAFSSDGKHLATGGLANSIIRVWDVVQGQEVRQMKGSGALIHALAFAPSAQALASGSEDGVVELWDFTTGTRKWQSRKQGEVLALAFAPDGKTLAASGGSGYLATHAKQHEPFFVLLDPGSGRELRRINTENNSVRSVAFSKDGKVLAAGLGNAIRVWDGIGEERTIARGHENSVASVAVTQDGRTALTGGSDGRLILWDLASGQEKRRLKWNPRWINKVACVPGGKLLAYSSSDQALRFWDLATGNEIQRLKASGALAVSPDGNTLVSGGQIWDLTTSQKLNALGPLGPWLHCLAFSPDGKTLAGGERSGVIGSHELHAHLFFWDANTGKKLREVLADPYAVQSLAFSPDGKILASTGTYDKTVSLWDVESAQKVFELPCGSVHGVVLFAPDGKTLAWGGYTGEICLWELASKKTRHTFPGHAMSVHSLAFSPDCRALISGSADTTAVVWDLTGLAADPSAQPPLSKDKLRHLWTALADADAAKAGRAIWALAADPKHGVPFLAERLRELPPAEPHRIPKLIADLDSTTFTVRDTAEKKLEALGKLAVPNLREALTRNVSLETSRRIGKLLKRPEAPIQAPEVLRVFRAVEALEHIGSPEARQALDNFARQSPEAYFEQDARAAAERLLKPGAVSVP